MLIFLKVIGLLIILMVHRVVIFLLVGEDNENIVADPGEAAKILDGSFSVIWSTDESDVSCRCRRAANIGQNAQRIFKLGQQWRRILGTISMRLLIIIILMVR
jgi:hypothetical protein